MILGAGIMDTVESIRILKLERAAVLQQLDVAMKYMHSKPMPLGEYRILMLGVHSYMKQIMLMDKEIEDLSKSLIVNL